MRDLNLLTKAQYDKLSPRAQGYATYMQAEKPGSQIPKKNPYPVGSKAYRQWGEGAGYAVIDVQDMEED